ncbi:hypothetical protein PR001_g24084 [Phytophthora rubi]|uniref:Ubiquitin-like domain-containing protein n=1 Tax=Phytophthora rubi TaxID=129364 RepID=A0A6A3IHT5_9STRA|nr:hypothetical protein PR001_g24084 [Phytophthora rubi]
MQHGGTALQGLGVYRYLADPALKGRLVQPFETARHVSDERHKMKAVPALECHPLVWAVDPEDDKQKQRVVVLQQVALTPQHDDGVLGKVFARCYGVRRGDDRAMDASAEAAEHVHLVVRNVFTSAQSLALRVDPRTRMGELKRRMSLEFPLSPAVPTQKLIFGGKICRDDEPLAQVQISHLKDGDAGSDEPVVFHLLVNAPASARKSAELKPQLHFLPTRHLREVGLLQLVGERVAFAFNAAVGK